MPRGCARPESCRSRMNSLNWLAPLGVTSRQPPRTPDPATACPKNRDLGFRAPHADRRVRIQSTAWMGRSRNGTSGALIRRKLGCIGILSGLAHRPTPCRPPRYFPRTTMTYVAQLLRLPAPGLLSALAILACMIAPSAGQADNHDSAEMGLQIATEARSRGEGIWKLHRAPDDGTAQPARPGKPARVSPQGPGGPGRRRQAPVRVRRAAAT